MKQEPPHRCSVVLAALPGVYATSIESGHHYGRHWHAAYGLGVLQAGAQRSASGRGPVDAYAGEVITTNPGEVHDGRPLGGATRRWQILYVEADAMRELLDAQGSLPEIAQPVIRDAQVQRALSRAMRCLQAAAGRSASGGDTLRFEEALLHATALLLQRHGTRRADAEAHAELAQVRSRLADDPLQAPTLAQLAAGAGLSKFQLLRRFRKCYGLTPYAWLLQQRAERARTLIRGGMGLAAAAAASGFADQSHMSRVFLRQFGFTPGAWQKARLQ